ncbi:ATP-binding cassette domain-containing protein [Jannaschia rubra]|uniref:Heterocyst differentiation ATP-binding protein HepA n=1 Tax=Jannaschia rubra TaxID=282197 RepID=A0A0M6XU44_9RHOB|nr:ATP-binding cassette domain-containing protein [Jannaschia rubra]CTQ34656.1 Heterocyst differentiation ATP-binding protein HepA [Jannaschia rubra]SFG65258.1 ABC transporter [Jannaschia rubra]
MRKPDLPDITIRLLGVRPSGTGKSTVFDVPTRLLDPDADRVVTGGQDIAATELRGLRSIFSVVTQDALLFDETILLGREDAPWERVRAAVEAANVAKLVNAVPLVLDTRSGPRASSRPSKGCRRDARFS